MRTHLDLFSGIGGFALAAQWNGFTTVGFCEIEPYAQKILIEKFGAILADTDRTGSRSSHRNPVHEERRASESGGAGVPQDTIGQNGPPKPNHRPTGPLLHPDIFTLRGTDYAGVDLITGGFPCQPFSCAGQRRGAADDRHLWPEMLRVIDEAGPAWVLAENVPGIIGMELDAVLSDLENIGYACWPVVVPACAVDARHRRDRVWIVAHAGHRHIAKRSRTEGWDPRQRTPERSESGPSGKALANTVQHGSPSGVANSAGRKEGNTAEPFDSCGPMGHTASAQPNQSREGNDGAWRAEFGSGCSSRWPVEPGLGRVASRIPNRSHRLKGLGNAIVPQVAAQIISWMT